MNPIVISVLLGLTAAAANGFGGLVVVQKEWDRNYLRYFIALGAGFMLGTARRARTLQASTRRCWCLEGT